jgi:polysaccharide export outer membrane protein
MMRWAAAAGLWLAFTLTVLLGGCAQTPLPPGAESAPAAVVGAPSAGGEYRLGVADKLRVIVYGEEALSGEYTVTSAGAVSFPLVGDVPAVGLTGSQFGDALTRRLADGFLRQPRVAVEVLTYRPFYILGEVTQPGEYPYTNGLTILNAVATAKGFTYRADQRRVFLKRAGDAVEREVPLTANLIIQPGDTIRIRERFF